MIKAIVVPTSGIVIMVAIVGAACAQVPPAIAALPGESVVATLHAEGAQIYECKIANDGKLAWMFREPIATLLLDDRTVGRHYAGPNWEHIDGSAVSAKAAGNAPGKTANDILWLDTQGGVHAGSCEKAGIFYSAPYRADYVFLRK